MSRILLVVASLMLVVCFVACGSGPSTTSGTAKTKADDAFGDLEYDPFEPGEITQIVDNDEHDGFVVLFPDNRRLVDWVVARSTDDFAAVNRIERETGSVRLLVGTNVKVLKCVAMNTAVEVVSGPYTGRRGVVLSPAVNREGRLATRKRTGR